MECMEIFYYLDEAEEFAKQVREPQIVETVDEDTNETVWVVNYLPPLR